MISTTVMMRTGPGARRKCRIQRFRVVALGHSLASLERLLRFLRDFLTEPRTAAEREAIGSI
jgi:hypothetical protein